MVKNSFYKNLYQSISWGMSCFVLISALLAGYFVSLQYGKNDGWLLLVFAAGVALLFFVIGFYWIFQKIEIDQTGIYVKLLWKTVRIIYWSNVICIEATAVMKNPAYVVIVRNQKHLNLDKRKKILDAIRLYYNGPINN